MKPFEDINTALPYKETDEYVGNLVARCSAEARLKSQRKPKLDRHYMRPWLYGAISIAAAAIAIAIFIWRPNHNSPSLSPIDSFLSALTQEELQMISDWSIDEIPEYYQ
ncbi:MAG: hypothetical protein ACI4TM_01045 [Candidatus Cryptobacteroides sp.]